MSKNMRAKVRVAQVTKSIDAAGNASQETVVFIPVSKSSSYPEDGIDEDNTFAKFSPNGRFELTIANPALLDTYRPGQIFYVDFAPVEN